MENLRAQDDIPAAISLISSSESFFPWNDKRGQLHMASAAGTCDKMLYSFKVTAQLPVIILCENPF